jgi:hypothetical protein
MSETANSAERFEDDKEFLEKFFEPANQAAIRMLRCTLFEGPPIDCGHRIKPKPTLEQYDKWS